MKLPNLPFLQKKESSDHFLALVFQDEKISSFIFEKVAQKITILAQHQEFFETSIDESNVDELVDLADKAISYAEDKVGKDLGVLKSIFGIKQNWVVEDKIKPEQLEKLKKVSSDLGLTPIGFITITDAIVNQIQREEGAPPSAVLADIGKKFVTVSLVKAGKIVESKTSEIHQSPVFTVDTLLKHLTMPEILPAKVYFIGDEELSQEFIGHQWSKSLPFLHLPQIINLEPQFVSNAFVSGVAKEMKAQLVGPTVKVEEIPDEPRIEIEEQTKEDGKSGIEYVGAADFGFVKNEDIAKKELEPELPIETPAAAAQHETKAGFALPASAAAILPFVKNSASFIKKFAFNIPQYLNSQNIAQKKRFFTLALIPIFLILLLLWYFLGLKAQVLLGVVSETKEVDQKVLFSTIQPTDFENNVIAAELVTGSELGSVTIPVTGKKETGDKAKGTVTVFNSTDRTVTFPANTTVTSSNDLKFLTLASVTVASQSGASDPFADKTPGKANVNVEASSFGTEYNLPSNTKFSIGTNPLIAAKNDNPFSGGSKREITVVSSLDFEKAQTELAKSLSEKGRDKVLAKVSEDKDVLQGFTNTDFSNESYDKEEGDEAKQLTLKATVDFETMVYKKSDLLGFAAFLFDSSIDGINENNLETSFKNIEALDPDEAEADLNLKARILPKLDIADLINKIKGKSFTEAENILLTHKDIKSAEFKFVPNLPFLPKNLPGISKNITITIADDR